MGFDNTAYGGQYPTQNPTHQPPSYEQSMMHHNPTTPSTPSSNNTNNNNNTSPGAPVSGGLNRTSSMNSSFTSTSSSATVTQSMSDSFIKNHELDTKYHQNDQAYDTGLVNLRPQTNLPQPINQYYVPQQQPQQQQQPQYPQYLQNQVVYPTLNNQIPPQQPYNPMNNQYVPPQQTLPPLPQKTQPTTMAYQKPMPQPQIPQHMPMHQPQPVMPMHHQPMMIPPQQPYIPPQQPVMMTQQPVVVTQRTVTQTYNTPMQPVFVSPPVVTQVPVRTTVVTTTTPSIVPPVGNVRVVHGPPPSMPAGAMGYSAYYPQHSVPVSSTTVYVQQKKKKSLFDKFVHGE